MQGFHPVREIGRKGSAGGELPRGAGCVRATNTRNVHSSHRTVRCGAVRCGIRHAGASIPFAVRLRPWYAKPGWVPASIVTPTRSFAFESILRTAGVSFGETRDALRLDQSSKKCVLVNAEVSTLKDAEGESRKNSF